MKIKGNLVYNEWRMNRVPEVVLYRGNPHSNLVVKDRNRVSENQNTIRNSGRVIQGVN